MDGGPPVCPPDFTCPAVLWIRPSPLNFAYGTLTLYGASSHTLQLALRITCDVRTPQILLPMVWPAPISLATTFGISVDVFSSPYLDVSVQAVPRVRLFYSTHAAWAFPMRVSPFGYPRINAHLQLPAAFRSLSRPSSAPDAKAFPLRSFQLDLSSLVPCSNYVGNLYLRNWLHFRAYPSFTEKPSNLLKRFPICCLLFFSLYSVFNVLMVEMNRFELSTPCLQGRCSPI